MNYIEELKETVDKARRDLVAAETYADSAGYKARIAAIYGEGADAFPSRLHLEAAVTIAKAQLTHASMLAERAAAELPWLERCAALCESLGVDEDNIAALELLKEKRYRSERDDLADGIREAAGEIISDTRERERDDAVTALEAAGFAAVERDDFEGWERVTACGESNCAQRASIETKRRGDEYWYEFTLDVDGAGTLHGKSGEFQQLLEAVGIKQESERGE